MNVVDRNINLSVVGKIQTADNMLAWPGFIFEFTPLDFHSPCFICHKFKPVTAELAPLHLIPMEQLPDIEYDEPLTTSNLITSKLLN